MRAELVVEAGQTAARKYVIEPEDSPILIGRRRNRPKDVHITQDEHASRDHSRITWDSRRECWLLEDRESTNGTKLNEEPITIKTELQHRDLIGVGAVRLRILLESEKPPNLSTSEIPVFASDPSTNDSIDQSSMTILQVDELAVLLEFVDAAFRATTIDGLLELALEKIRDAVTADMVGFLELSKKFGVRMSRPQEVQFDARLSRRLTERMMNENRTVWLLEEEEPLESESLLGVLDAVCVPVGVSGRLAEPRPIQADPLGALHVYRSQTPFTQREAAFCDIFGICLTHSYRMILHQLVLEAESSRAGDSGVIDDKDLLLGKSKALRGLCDEIRKLARVPCSVLIIGETGSGKELVARSLHKFSTRHDRPFVAFNCASLTSSMADSLLFGHAKGSFTGADKDHRGIFRRAEGGTLFLDEIGEMNAECQAKLLRALEQRTITPVGGEEDISIDVRVIAATNRDLQAEVAAKKFRADLVFRLGAQLHVPALREHPEDIADLADHFLQQFRTEYRTKPAMLSMDAIETLKAYHWPGNVRELRVVIERAVITCENTVVQPSDLGLDLDKAPVPDKIVDSGSAVGSQAKVSKEELEEKMNLDNVEKEAILTALAYTDNNKTKAANVLGICRDTLIRKLKKYESDEKRQPVSDEGEDE